MKELGDDSRREGGGKGQWWGVSRAESVGEAGGKEEDGDAQEDAVDGERAKAAAADPIHEPGDAAVGHDERDHEADDQNDPPVGIDVRDADGAGMLADERFQQVVAGGDDHGGHGEEEREFEGRSAGHSGELARRDRGHGARSARKDSGKNLASPDPDSLA